MIEPDFSKYSLALLKDNKIVYSSDKSGLRPLVECIEKCKGKFKACTLHDKVIGLAAARLVVYSGMVSSVLTLIASEPAVELLENSNISINPEKVVESILTKDRSSLCPMEQKARKITDNKLFFEDIKNKMKDNKNNNTDKRC